jgi:hypothetical protein
VRSRTRINSSVADPVIECIDIGTIDFLNSTLLATMNKIPKQRKVEPTV